MSADDDVDDEEFAVVTPEDFAAMLSMEQVAALTENVQSELNIREEILTRELCRRRLAPFVARLTPDFVPGWHIDEICAACEQIEAGIQTQRGTDARLILEAPPRHTKSQTTSKCLPLWYLGRHPGHEVIVATYGQDLADDIGRWAKRLVQDPLFTTVFPELEIRSDSRAADRMETTQGGGIRYVGVGSALTGRGGHLIIVDDPIKNSEEADSEAASKTLWDWYTSVLRTRLAPGGGIVVMHTRWRVNDLIGKLLAAQESGGERYRRLSFPMEAKEDDPWGRKKGEPLQPGRFSMEDMQALKSALLTQNPRDWWSLYQQEPMPAEGNVFKVEDFNLYKPGSQPKDLYWFICCDLAVSTSTHADYSVIWPVGIDPDGCLWFSPDFLHLRMESPQIAKEILRFAKEKKAHGIVMEGGVIFKAVAPTLKGEMQRTGQWFELFDPSPVHDKLTRSRPLHAQMRAGMAKFPDTRMTREVVIPEFLMFTGKNDDHDDLVDAAAWAALHAATAIRPSKGEKDKEEEEGGDVVKGSYADLERRLPKDKSKRKHSPPRLLGGERKKGREHNYA